MAIVGFGFDGWNKQYTPYDDDALGASPHRATLERPLL